MRFFASPLSAVVRAAVRSATRRTARAVRGRVRLRGLDAPVEIIVDRHGVPHIRAQSDADAFFAQGYLHAQDRFFQMDMLRRVLSGRLAETIGERSLGDTGHSVSADHLMRVLGLRDAAARVVDTGADDDRELIDAYVAGVNACMQKTLRRNRPIEHRLLRLPLEPWTPVDSVLVAKGMALGLSFKWRTLPVLGAIADRLRDDPERLRMILPPVEGDDWLTSLQSLGSAFEGLLSLLPASTPAAGSNAFVIGKDRSKSGMPLLASDPHLTLSLPNVWYLSSVRGATYQAVGATLPGLPGVVVGRTPGVAWGVTNGMVDDADFWQETLDSGEALYKVDDEWRPLEIETQALGRKGKSPQLIRVRRTHRGPIITDAFPGYSGKPMSLRMTLHENTPDLQAFLALGRARTVEQAEAAVEGFGSPAQNFVFADTQGKSAYRLVGLVPQRAFAQHPALPHDGSTSAGDWTGFARASDLPQAEVMPGDVMVTANDPHPPCRAGYLSHLYEPPYRAVRLRQRFQGHSALTIDDLSDAQIDTVDLGMQRFRDEIVRPHIEGIRKEQPTHGVALDRVVSWDGRCDVDSSGAVLVHWIYHHLVRRTFEPTLGGHLMNRWLGQMNLANRALHEAFAGDDSVWAPATVRRTLLIQALDDTLHTLRERKLTLDSTWGAFHRLTLKHPAGEAPFMAKAFGRGPFATPGAPFTPNSGQYVNTNPGPMEVGASYRHVIDMADPESGRMVIVGGQSGHPGSPNYDDQIALWLQGGGVPMKLTHPPKGRRILLTP